MKSSINCMKPLLLVTFDMAEDLARVLWVELTTLTSSPARQCTVYAVHSRILARENEPMGATVTLASTSRESGTGIANSLGRRGETSTATSGTAVGSACNLTSEDEEQW